MYNGKKVAIGNICSLVFFYPCFYNVFYKSLENMLFLFFFFANQCF